MSFHSFFRLYLQRKSQDAHGQITSALEMSSFSMSILEFCKVEIILKTATLSRQLFINFGSMLISGAYPEEDDLAFALKLVKNYLFAAKLLKFIIFI